MHVVYLPTPENPLIWEILLSPSVSTSLSSQSLRNQNNYIGSLSHSKCLLVKSLVWHANQRAASVWDFSFFPDTGRDVWLFRLSHVISGSSHEKKNFSKCENRFFLTFIYQRKTWPLIYSLSWRIRNRTSERSEQVSFLIQKRVWKYCTKPFPCGIGFIIYILRFKFLFNVFNDKL